MPPILTLLADASPWWDKILQRCVDEMSPAYLVFVGILVVAVRLGYRYLNNKITYAAEKEKAFLLLMENTLSVIKELDSTIQPLKQGIDRLRADHDELLSTLGHEHNSSIEETQTRKK